MPSRRQFLAACSVALVGGAGCTSDATTDETTDAGTTAAESGTGDTDTETTDAAGGDRVRIAVSDGDEERDLATGDGVATVGDVESARQGGYQVSVTLTDDGADAFTDGLEAIGAFDDPSAHEIRTYLDGERVYTAMLGPDLAAAMESGEWDGRLLAQFDDRERAEEMRDALGGA